ncbi:hypothetical protein CRG98_011587 [Punica granatum]|uniref:Uncharacterized protein n=1 Tax=Punica granatum TaxID=22663 RepID=A0A2I0KHQ6_PUNGR|nr:hypothetical protein CRG98_011587 [Punica granatum]
METLCFAVDPHKYQTRQCFTAPPHHCRPAFSGTVNSGSSHVASGVWGTYACRPKILDSIPP